MADKAEIEQIRDALNGAIATAYHRPFADNKDIEWMKENSARLAEIILEQAAEIASLTKSKREALHMAQSCILANAIKDGGTDFWHKANDWVSTELERLEDQSGVGYFLI